MSSRPDPAAVAALAGAGALIGHEVGYLAAADAGVGHGHIAWMVPVALGVAIVGFWASALSVLRRLPTPAPSVASLALVQSAIYLVLEVGERLVGFGGTSLFSVPVFLGLAAQPLVAWAAVRLLRLGNRIVAQLVETPPSPLLPVRSEWRAFTSPRLVPVRVATVPARGPPGLR